MKGFIISLTLFLLLLSVIIINAIYINEGIDRLTASAESLGSFDSSNFSDNLDKLEESWDEFRAIADISCSYSELNKIDTALYQLRAYAATESLEDYEATRATLVLLLRDLARLEKITLKGLI